MLMTHFIWQTVLKPLSVTDAKNGAITPSLTPTMQTRGEGPLNVHFCGPPKHKGALFRPLVVAMQAGAGGGGMRIQD
jgi:hypothetical protein